MAIYFIICLFLLFFSAFDFADKKRDITVLYWLAFLMIIFVGLRGNSGTDTLNYINFFKEYTDSLWDWKGVEKQYSEYGFYYLSVLIKSIFDNIHFYFILISLLTVSLLVKSLKSYCILPIFGFCVYFMRFLLTRDMNQIRQALSIAIIIYALKFLVENKVWKYVWMSLLAVTIHYSSVIVLPFAFLYQVKRTWKQTLFILLLSGILGLVLGTVLKAILISTGFTILLTYVGDENLGIYNPVIYYQSLLCLSFFYFEKKFANIQPGYYVIRNAYLYSTIILLLSCNMGVIGGRLATIFATCEIFIIPALVYAIHPKRYGFLGLVILISIFFYLNYLKLAEVGTWEYSFPF